MLITIQMSKTEAEFLQQALVRANSENNAKPQGNLTMRTLAEMLLSDVGLAVRDPAAWGASSMAQVLAARGYAI